MDPLSTGCHHGLTLSVILSVRLSSCLTLTGKKRNLIIKTHINKSVQPETYASWIIFKSKKTLVQQNAARLITVINKSITTVIIGLTNTNQSHKEAQNGTMLNNGHY